MSIQTTTASALRIMMAIVFIEVVGCSAIMVQVIGDQTVQQFLHQRN